MPELGKVTIPEESERGDVQTQQSYKDQRREHRSCERSIKTFVNSSKTGPEEKTVSLYETKFSQ